MPPKKRRLVYCLCGKPPTDNMIACDMDDCLVEWYHLHCVGLDATSVTGVTEWFCPDCDGKSMEKLQKEGRKYCNCGNPTHANMVACQNKNCVVELYHRECTGLKPDQIVPQDWMCDACIEPTIEKITEFLASDDIEYKQNNDEGDENQKSDVNMEVGTATAAKPTFCLECGVTLDSLAALEKHMLEHKSNQPKKTGPRIGRPPGTEHMRSEVVKVKAPVKARVPVGPALSCNLCHTEFQSVEMLAIHSHLCRRPSQNLPEKKFVEVSEDEEEYDFQPLPTEDDPDFELPSEKKQKKGKQKRSLGKNSGSGSEGDVQGTSEPAAEQTKVQRFHCNVCARPFTYGYHLKKHIERVHSKEMRKYQPVIEKFRSGNFDEGQELIANSEFGNLKFPARLQKGVKVTRQFPQKVVKMKKEVEQWAAKAGPSKIPTKINDCPAKYRCNYCQTPYNLIHELVRCVQGHSN